MKWVISAIGLVRILIAGEAIGKILGFGWQAAWNFLMAFFVGWVAAQVTRD